MVVAFDCHNNKLPMFTKTCKKISLKFGFAVSMKTTLRHMGLQVLLLTYITGFKHSRNCCRIKIATETLNNA